MHQDFVFFGLSIISKRFERRDPRGWAARSGWGGYSFAADPAGPLSPTAQGKKRAVTRGPMGQPDVFRMIRKPAA